MIVFPLRFVRDNIEYIFSSLKPKSQRNVREEKGESQEVATNLEKLCGRAEIAFELGRGSVQGRRGGIRVGGGERGELLENEECHLLNLTFLQLISSLFFREAFEIACNL